MIEYFKRSSSTYAYSWCWVVFSDLSLSAGSLLIEEDGTILASNMFNRPLPNMAATKWEI